MHRLTLTFFSPRRRARTRQAGLALAATLLLASCGGGGTSSSGFLPFLTSPPPSAPPTSPPPALRENIDAQLPNDTASKADRCEFLDPSHCMLPFPNDHFTVADSTTDTGRRVSLKIASMPRSAIVNNRPIDTTEWNRNDGFSPGAMLVTRVPGVDLATSGAPQLTDISVSLAKDSPVLLLDAETLEPQLVWAELDANAAADRQSLNIRVAKNLVPGRRYVAALRNLKDAQGHALEAAAAFRIYRDRHESALDFVNGRRPHMETLFDALGRAGIARESLYLAWDFTVASQRNLTGRLLTIRDTAFGALGDQSPTFHVKSWKDFTPQEDSRIARRVEGFLTVPSFVTAPTEGTADIMPVAAAIAPYLSDPENVPLPVEQLKAAFATIGDKPLPLPSFRYASATPGANDVPIHDGKASMKVPFICNIPRSVLDSNGSVKPARISLYGHGLFGKHSEVNASNVKDMASEYNFVFCATNWYGFSETELLPSVFAFLDLSNARVPFDTTQQGILNTLWLGRAMVNPKGFSQHKAFQMGASESSVLDISALYYDGNSQGGILGGALMAVAQDIKRGVLGVPGMNYSLLLERSSDFPTFAQMVYAAYPDGLDQQFVFSLWQMLWDRAEANGYAYAMTDRPLPNTPAHQVLLHVAHGDHQVTMWSAEIEARTIGAKLQCPALAPGRHPDSRPYFGLECLRAGTADQDGSAIVLWDSGPGRVPVGSLPQNNLPPTVGKDPHSDPRSTPAARMQKSEFLKEGGKVVDACFGTPCKNAAYAP